MRERLKAKPDAVMCRYLFGPTIQGDSMRSFDNMAKMNLAHALMLRKEGIIPAGDADGILRELVALREKGSEAFVPDPQLEDYYMNTENYLIQQLGAEQAGKLHTARSRNDLHSTVARMNVRDSLLHLCDLLLRLRATLLDLAEEHRDVILTGYTHMQPAQPITLGHYFLAIAEALERDQQRLLESYGRVNRSTLGSCAFAGTGFAIDREYTAALMGFDGVVCNSIDAVASRDYLMELAAGYAILGSTLSRFANDLYYWATDEFGYVEVDDSLAASSSIMPQKKNPITLEHIKAKSAHLVAAFVSITGSLKTVPYGHNRDTGGESLHGYWDATAELEAMLVLMERTLGLLVVNSDHLKERADRNFSTVTELADEMVKKTGMPFRTAHQIVGNIAMQLSEQKKTTKDITLALLDQTAEQYTGAPLGWTQEHLDTVLDAAYSVKNKISQGAPSPGQCDSMLAEQRDSLEADEAAIRGKREQLANADMALENAVRQATRITA